MQNIITKAATKAASVTAIVALGLAAPFARADEDPAKSVELRLEGSCDANNSRLWVVNNHATKAIIASLRWSLANSKRIVSDQFQVAAGSKLEVGCAAKADIVGATFAP